jgi:predicted nucleic acid-binding protein
MNAVDTNVLVYAYDESHPGKRAAARQLLAETLDIVLLYQVACEFVAASRKLGGAPEQAWTRLAELQAVFPLVLPTARTLESAAQIHSQTQAHVWDCMIFAACAEAGVTTLFSEDVPSRPPPTLKIVNPFR